MITRAQGRREVVRTFRVTVGTAFMQALVTNSARTNQSFMQTERSRKNKDHYEKMSSQESGPVMPHVN